MSVREGNNPLDLLGLGAPPARQDESSSSSGELHSAAEPQLAIGWGDFHQGALSNFAELFRRARLSKSLLSASFFKEVWIENPVPRRAVLAAALWHVVFVVMPFPRIGLPRHNPAFANSEITWSGPVEDFPLLEVPAARPKPVARTAPNQPPPPGAVEAFHPRQRIFTDPVRPNHPRQTLIQTKAPLEAPKILPSLPNVVELARSAQPVRPRLEINPKFLKQLHPREKRIARDPNAAAPEVQLSDQRAADIMLAMTNAGPERPKLQINASAAPRAAQHKQDGAAEPAPDVASQLAAPNGSGQTLIALSATPGPPAPVAPPPGNLAARVAISPEGKKSAGNSGADASANGAGSGSGNAASTNSVGVSISGGSPKTSSTMSGVSTGKLSMPSTRPNYARAEAARVPDEPAASSGPPNFAALAPDARPEAVFARRRVYSLNVNMPNLNSATGSWILNFTEMRTAPGPQTSEKAGDKEGIAEPVPVRKVDPKYPPTAIAEHIEGEVILYAVIRRDGSVDSIQLVRGIDPELDANAMRALGQWKFRPAERGGEPVDLEAVVHIPFRAPER